MARLKIQITRNFVQVVEVGGPIVIGRGKEADLVLLDQLISRRHVQIAPVDGGVMIEDLASANGTLVNDVRVHSQLLQEGDRISVGKTILIFTMLETALPQRTVDLTGEVGIEEIDADAIAAERDVEFRFYSNQDIANQIVALSNRMLEKTSLDDMELSKAETAINEAIGNAVRHGHEYDESKVVRYRWTRSDDRLVFWVEDQGPGFDYRAALQRGLEMDAAAAARERYQEGGMGGLGILMMLRCVDRVEYNQLGNELTLTKFLTSETGEDLSPVTTDELRDGVTPSGGHDDSAGFSVDETYHEGEDGEDDLDSLDQTQAGSF